jgi:hypothetical protein
LGISALSSGILLILKPDGSLLKLPLYTIAGSPFMNFFIPGLVLAIFVGIYPLVIAFGLLKKPSWDWPNIINPFRSMHWSFAGSLAAGLIAIIWLLVELIWVPYAALHTIIFIWGGLIILLTLLPPIRRYLTIYHRDQKQ